MSLLLCFATVIEAQSTIEALAAKAHSRFVYDFEEGQIIITGWGAIAAAIATARHIKNVNEVWNLGAAGLLRHNSHSVGNIVEVGEVGRAVHIHPEVTERAQRICQSLFAPISLTGDGNARLLSSDYPVDNNALRALHAEHFDLVDMEAYGIASAAQSEGIPCRITKIITDFADENAAQSIAETLQKSSQTLAQVVTSSLTQKITN